MRSYIARESMARDSVEFLPARFHIASYDPSFERLVQFAASHLGQVRIAAGGGFNTRSGRGSGHHERQVWSGAQAQVAAGGQAAVVKGRL